MAKPKSLFPPAVKTVIPVIPAVLQILPALFHCALFYSPKSDNVTLRICFKIILYRECFTPSRIWAKHNCWPGCFIRQQTSRLAGNPSQPVAYSLKSTPAGT